MLSNILSRAPARSVDDVVSIMTAIDHRLPDNDGLKWFNRLYLGVTVSVRGALGATFADPAFVEHLDVVFANQYFSAIGRSDGGPSGAPAAWRPLLQARHADGIARLQFALAGMNAHINRDLPEGIVQTFKKMGGDPVSDETRRRDFESVNAVLERVEAEVKAEFSVGVIREVDMLAGQLDDVIAMWNVRAARAAAWTHAQVLWSLESVPRVRNAFFDKLDGLTGFAGRGLLAPRGLTHGS